MQMFLRVSDLYSFEKIISVFHEIVLLYFLGSPYSTGLGRPAGPQAALAECRAGGRGGGGWGGRRGEAGCLRTPSRGCRSACKAAETAWAVHFSMIIKGVKIETEAHVWLEGGRGRRSFAGFSCLESKLSL